MKKYLVMIFEYKKLFFSMMMVGFAASISIGVTSCSKDNNQPEIDDSRLIMGQWRCLYSFEGGVYRIEFKTDGTYNFENLKLGSGEGNYKIYETLKNQKITFEGDDEIYNATLYKMLASENNGFDQIWVYHYIASAITVEFYSNNELLPDKLWVYYKEGS